MADATHVGSDAAFTGLRLLVVDDHRDSADTLAMLLDYWGHQPLVAYDAASALQAATMTPPDAVILDLGLPGRDGCELAGDLRRLGTCTGVPFVALTGFTDQGRRQQARAAGFDHYLIKPVEPAALQRLLGEMLRVRLLACRMDQLARRHGELAREGGALAEEARQHVAELRHRLEGTGD